MERNGSLAKPMLLYNYDGGLIEDADENTPVDGGPVMLPTVAHSRRCSPDWRRAFDLG